MFRKPILTAIAAILMLVPFQPAHAQRPELPEATRAKQLPRQHLLGPRFGFTTFTGDIADKRNPIGKEAITSQFGWQFETQIVSLTGGNRARMEWVFLVGGEQGELNLSLSWMTGYHLPNGVEFGVGPKISITKENSEPTTSMVIAAGTTMLFSDLYDPVNVAVAFAEGGPSHHDPARMDRGVTSARHSGGPGIHAHRSEVRFARAPPHSGHGNRSSTSFGTDGAHAVSGQ